MTHHPPDDLDAAHHRLAHGATGARDGLFDVALRRLPEFMAALRAKRGAALNTDAAWDFLVDALMRVADGASRFDPGRGRLFHYLVMEVAGDLSNQARGAGRRRARELDHAGQAAADPPAESEAGTLEEREWEKVRLEEARRWLGPRDFAYLSALHRRADPAELAALLGVDPADAEAGKYAVDCARDRIRVRLKRAGLIGD